MAVYLIHFEKPYKQARHYLGWTPLALEDRIKEHERGNGSKLMAVISQAGIGWQVVRVWEGGDQNWENRLKELHKSPDLCPVCNPDRWEKRMAVVDNSPIKRKYHRNRVRNRKKYEQEVNHVERG